MQLMEKCRSRTMAVWWWLALLGLAAVGVRVHGQLDSLGFISIDCGLPEKSSYVDDTTKLPYTSDAQFIDSGANHNISAEFITPTLSKSLLDVRSFPTGARNCYTLRSLVAGLKYLVRASFLYANYDGLSKPPIFDLYLGVNFWRTVNISDANVGVQQEIITVIPSDFIQVCLVNIGSGTPFISGLDLRPLKNILYPAVNATQAIVLFRRLNMGPTDDVVVRYPADPHDRIWVPWSDPSELTEISTTKTVQNLDNDKFEAPSAVLQTAVTPINSSKNIELYWDAEPQPTDPAPGYITTMHFSELQRLAGNATRQFYINLNGKLWYPLGFTPEYLFSDAVFTNNPSRGFRQYNISINATANSTLPPIINAIEVFTVLPTINLGTDSGDVTAIMAIKAKYQVKRNWMGDPCVPKTLAWDGLSCSYAISSPPRITNLNLSFSGLSGDISSSFANLKAIQYLDLSHNNLTGSIPDALSQLPSLTVLDLTGNQLNGSIPDGLLKRSQDGSLTLRVGENANICGNGNSCQLTKKKSSMLVVYIAVPIVAVVLIVAVVILVFCILRKKQGSTNTTIVKPQNDESYMQSHNILGDSSLQLENRQFTYKELEAITTNFQRVLGRGGFGYVYDGFLENGTQVAVKLRSQSSNQGVKEFLAEAQTLTRIHHKNLVSMIGYCKDGEYLALVYEYMSEGTLQEHLRGRDRSRSLTWRQRLRIALESAQGLEYLHKGCNPPLIHRDVKTTNILLNANLEAKIADFGLSKAFNRDVETHVSTTVVGTVGYVDPEYHATLQLNEKSDVYSFGVVLLEVITGQPAIVAAPAESTHIAQWVRQRLARGNIESVVDARMQGEYDVNGVWKAADIALKCTAQASAQRPTMTDVVMQLRECFELENGGDNRSRNFYSGSSDPNSSYMYTDQSTDVRQNSAFEMEHMGRVPTMATGPAAR